MSTTKGDVILFKSRDDGATPSSDPYEESFKGHGYVPWFVPVLQHRAVNEEEFERLLLDGPQDRFGAVIVTSGKAAEIWMQSSSRLDFSGSGKSSVPWSDLPFYVVGVRTESILKKNSSLPLSSAFIPKLILGAEESGTGVKLAEFIIRDYPSRFKCPPSTSATSPPILYLVGDKTTGGLTLHIEAAGLRPYTFQVYRTWARDDFDEDIRATMQCRRSVLTHGDDVDHTVSGGTRWVAFFSPSSARAVLPTLRRYFSFYDTGDEGSNTQPRVYVAAIGPTTASYLETAESLVVHVVSSNPKPRDLAGAISSYDLCRAL